jgi:hypothetical protein
MIAPMEPKKGHKAVGTLYTPRNGLFTPNVLDFWRSIEAAPVLLALAGSVLAEWSSGLGILL